MVLCCVGEQLSIQLVACDGGYKDDDNKPINVIYPGPDCMWCIALVCSIDSVVIFCISFFLYSVRSECTLLV